MIRITAFTSGRNARASSKDKVEDFRSSRFLRPATRVGLVSQRSSSRTRQPSRPFEVTTRKVPASAARWVRPPPRFLVLRLRLNRRRRTACPSASPLKMTVDLSSRIRRPSGTPPFESSPLAPPTKALFRTPLAPTPRFTFRGIRIITARTMAAACLLRPKRISPSLRVFCRR